MNFIFWRRPATNPTVAAVEASGFGVVSQARKLVFRVPPAEAAHTTTFPEGANVSAYGQNNENPAIVVFNATDIKQDPHGSWQGADAKTGVVIVNEVQGSVAEDALQRLGKGYAIAALVEELKRLASLGYRDQYTTSTQFAESKLSPAGTMLDRFTGIVKRDDHDIAHVAKRGRIVFIVADGDIRHIEPDILERTYVMADGAAIDLRSIPKV